MPFSQLACSASTTLTSHQLLKGVVKDLGIEVDITVGKEVFHGSAGDELPGGACKDLTVGGDEP